MGRTILFAILASIGAAIMMRSWCAEPDGKQRVEAPRVKVTVSKETTYITEPLRPDGYPDYLAALDQRRSEGVTPENNAAVPLMQALGPEIIPKGIRHEALLRLGLGELDEKAVYALSKNEMTRWWRTAHPAEAALISDDELEDQFNQAASRPWSSNEFPIVVEWLTFNHRPLELARAAAERPKFYFPALAQPGSLGVMAAQLSLPQESRAVADSLITRAMRRLGSGDVEGAWADLLACHRLARLVAQGSCLVEPIIGCAIEQMALKADCALAHYAKLDAKQAARMQADLQALAPLPSIAEKIDFGERIAFLDATVYIASHQDRQSIENVVHQMTSGDSQFAETKTVYRLLLDPTEDWDVCLRLGNQWCDRMVAVSRITDPRQRRSAMLELEGQMKSLAKKAKDTQGSTNERAGSALVASFLPPIIPAAWAEDRAKLVRQMAVVSFGLSGYRADCGHYPEKLDDLIPKYLAELPDDTFAGKPTPVKYRRDAGAYLLWSVGENGVDDGGRNDEDNPRGDDIVLRPVPTTKAENEAGSKLIRGPEGTRLHLELADAEGKGSSIELTRKKFRL